MILALETSTVRASLALWDETERDLVWSFDFTTDRSHNSVIFQPVEEALKKCGRRLDLIAVGLGPGSYSGVRVGIAVANGLSLALGARTFGISSLEAYLPGCEDYLVVGDARRHTGFLARIGGGESRGEPELIANEALSEKLEEAMADGLRAVTPDRKIADRFGAVELSNPVAEQVAQRAASLLAREGCEPIIAPLEPHYLRPPFITTPKRKNQG